MSSHKVRLLYLTAEAWPTHRADIVTLFGKWLPRFGVESDLLTERSVDYASNTWHGGTDLTFGLPKRKALFYIGKFLSLIARVAAVRSSQYDAIQVRDMPVIAFFALIIARLKSIPFYYWMSYPQSEGQVYRAKARGPAAGMRYWFPLIQGSVGKFLLYKFILPKSDHVFVQSEQMQKDLMQFGILANKMTPVPMGVDIEAIESLGTTVSDDARLAGKRVIAYLGTLDRARQIEVLFAMLGQVLDQFPDAVLLLVGDTEDQEHRAWLQQQAEQYNVAHAVIWTGWLPTQQAWSYIRGAEIGLSTFPRSYLLDSASPTKVVEYMAIGLPVIGNDNPDQQLVISESSAGLCVELDAQKFSQAVIELLSSLETRVEMAAQGKKYILDKRGYHKLAENLASVYQRLIH